MAKTDASTLVENSNTSKEWRFRPPPLGQTPDQYLRCASLDVTRCNDGQFCVRAHSEEELAEWVQRFDPGKFLDKVGRGYVQSRVQCDQSSRRAPPYSRLLVQPSQPVVTVHKAQRLVWTVRGTASSLPEAIALLDPNTRSYFKLLELCDTAGARLAQLEGGEWRRPEASRGRFSDNPFVGVAFSITVSFCADVYGEFQQRLAAVFPAQAPLVCQLAARVEAQTTGDLIEQLQQKLAVSQNEWSADNLEKVPFSPSLNPSLNDSADEQLLKRFPPPEDTLTPPVQEPLTAERYVSWAGALLSLEEATRAEMLQRFNATATMQLTDCYCSQDAGQHQPPPGELFGVVQLKQQLSPDHAAGRLVLESCQRALLAPPPTSQNWASRAYEALIMAKNRREIVFRLSEQMVKDLNLAAACRRGELRTRVRFQPARLPFCEMQEGIRLAASKAAHLLFPDPGQRPVVPWSPASQWRAEDDHLNPRQKEAINAMVAETDQPLPPVLVLGPYGTGKTFTMAHGMLHILKSRPDARILICTHSNSAADLYITEYIAGWVESGLEMAEPVRIYYSNRWLGTVHPLCRKYALLEADAQPGDPPFRRPTQQDVLRRRVVVATLSITKYLTRLRLPEATFSHILVDEAAQALEWEVARVLSLAGPSTRLVLAGDHLQMAPDVHNELCRELGFHRSLLERLQHRYPANFPCSIMLYDNYRSHEAIVKMTSDLFYGKRLRARGCPPAHPALPPLSFFCVRGKAKQTSGSTGFCNESEVFEVCDLVGALLANWPERWQHDGEDSVCVVAAYTEQVQMIRSELRSRRLSNVTVERLQNVQGRQFRVVVVSTVRTLDSCAGGDDYAFLSDGKLLNTAITRAKSLLAVVGCPVTLCTVGKCARYWEELLRRVDALDGLYGCTLDELHSRLGAETLRRLHGLNPLADSFQPLHAQLPQLGGWARPPPPLAVKSELVPQAEPCEEGAKEGVGGTGSSANISIVEAQEEEECGLDNLKGGDKTKTEVPTKFNSVLEGAQVNQSASQEQPRPCSPAAPAQSELRAPPHAFAPQAHLSSSSLNHFPQPNCPLPLRHPLLPPSLVRPHHTHLGPTHIGKQLLNLPPYSDIGVGKDRKVPLIPEGPRFPHSMVMPYVTPVMTNGLAGGYPVSLVGRPLVVRPPMLAHPRPHHLPPYMVGVANGWPVGAAASAAISGADRQTVFEQLTTTDLLALLPPDVNLSRLLSDSALQADWRSVLAARQGPAAVVQFSALVDRFRDIQPSSACCQCAGKGGGAAEASSRPQSSGTITAAPKSGAAATSRPPASPSSHVTLQSNGLPPSPLSRPSPSPPHSRTPPVRDPSPSHSDVSTAAPRTAVAANTGDSVAQGCREVAAPVAEMVVDALLSDEEANWQSRKASVREEHSVPLYLRGAAGGSPPPADVEPADSSYAAAVRRSLEPAAGSISALPRREDHAHGYSHF